jgi:hypothetical protein
MEEPDLHFHIYFHGIMLNELSTVATLHIAPSEMCKKRLVTVQAFLNRFTSAVQKSDSIIVQLNEDL